MKYIKSIFFVLVIVTIGVITFLFREELVKLYTKYLVNINKDVKLEKKNEYYRNYNYDYVKNTDNFKPKSRQDLLNIYYTVLNAGVDEFSFYCEDSWEECVDEVKYLANNQIILSNINNFVHPYNSFKHLETEYDNLGKVTLYIDKIYSNSQIKIINNKIEEIYNKLKSNKLSVEDQIKAYHDYIINITKYDSTRSDDNVVKYSSDTAYGPLFEGRGLCGGYTDVMALLLEKDKINNYKVSSENHVWNAVLLKSGWKHLDLTWDDPVSSDGKDMLEHDFFLIDTKTLLENEKLEHIFDADVYKELQNESL